MPFRTKLRTTFTPLAATVSLLFAACALAQQAPPTIVSGHVVRIWQTEDGLPQNTVNAILQTSDGYLWVGTYGGLARFDGVRFQVFDAINTPTLKDARIMSLHQDAQGTLWIGHDSGQVSRFKDGKFEPLENGSAFATKRANAISSDVAGRVWLLRQNGVLESATDGTTAPGIAPLDTPGIRTMVRTNSGELYLCRTGEVWKFDQSGAQALEFAPARRSTFTLNIGASARGGIWLVRDWHLQRWDGSRLEEDRGPCPWGGDTAISAMLELSDGRLAVGTMDRGLYLYSPYAPVVHFDRTSGLPQNWVRSLCEDREGNLWVGAGSAGLIELTPSAFSVLNAPDQWQGRGELSIVAGRDGALWVGTEGAGLYRYHRGAWKHYGEEEGLQHLFVWSVAEDRAGNIWAGTWSAGIYQLEGDHFVRWPDYDAKSGPVLALHFPPENHDLWIGSGAGVQHRPGDAATAGLRVVAAEDQQISTVLTDGAGGVWFGLVDGGLGHWENGQTRRFRKAEGLSSDSVQCLWLDRDGALWVGTADAGLNRFKNGRFSSIGVAQGLGSNTICHIADDGAGFVYISTHHGLLRVAKEELDRCADGKTPTVSGLIFDRRDGLPTIEFAGGLQAAGSKSADGKLWFTSSKGIVSVDPERLRLNRAPPPVVLESMQVDNRAVSIAASGGGPIQLQPEHQRIEFFYTALSLSAPGKVKFKYRVDGIDHDWVDADTRRSASYSHLPAGRYAFRVIACNNDGVWNTQGASVALVVLPFFWETWWFLGLAALTVLSLVVLLVRHFTRRRLQRRLEDLQRRHAIERERARIAQDIHDDIGANLTRITMLSQCLPAESETPAARETANVLVNIYDTAREVTRSLDEIVWAANPRHDSLDSLVSYMGHFAQDFLAAANVRCRLDLPVKLPDWPLTAEIRHNVFLAFKEALNNTLKHADATEVRVALRLEPDAFVLTISDNGRGFETAETGATEADRSPTRNGLENLRRRLAGLGGRCEIASTAGVGTQVTFIVFPSGSAAPDRGQSAQP